MNHDDIHETWDMRIWMSFSVRDGIQDDIPDDIQNDIQVDIQDDI